MTERFWEAEDIPDVLQKLRNETLASPKDTLDSAVDWCIQYIAILQNELQQVDEISGYKQYVGCSTGAHYTRNGYLANMRRNNAELTRRSTAHDDDLAADGCVE